MLLHWALCVAALVIYCASKAAVISMTKNTACMYIKDGIRANAIEPGGITSEIAISMGVPNANGYSRIQPVLACAPEPGSTEEMQKLLYSWQATILPTSVVIF